MSKVQLSDIAKIVMGQSPKGETCNLVGDGKPLLNGPTEFGDFYPIAKQFTTAGNRFSIKGDILFCVRGSTTGRMNWADREYVLGRGLASIRHKKGNNYNHYLKYLIDTNLDSILKSTSGSTFPNLTSEMLNSFVINVLSDINAKKVNDFLKNIDAKIELNNRINRELEAMAKTLYDYWFVQFDFPCLPSDYRPSGQVNPNSDLAEKIKAFSTYTKVGGLPLPDGIKWFVYVILCEDGSFYKGMTNDLYRRFYEHYTGQGADWTKTHKPKKIIHWEQFNTQDEARRREEELKTGFSRTWLQRENEKIKKYGYKAIDGLPAHQTRLMPAGKMVYNAELKRGIPEGWEVKTFFKCCRVQYGFPFSTDYFNTVGNGIPVIRIRDILENSISNYSSEQNIDTKYLINKGDILVGMDGNFHINYWAKDNCYLNQRAVKLSETILPNIYLKYQIEPFIKLREKSVSRTTVGHLSDKDLKSLSIIIPSKEVLSSITSIYNGVLQRMIQTKNENQHLSELRDWLLPMLMNGQVVSTGSTTRAEVPEPVEGIAAEPNVEYKKG